MNAIENILTQPFAQRIGWTLLHSLWQITAVAVLLMIAAGVLRKRTANIRYLIACVALLLTVILPAATFMLLDAPVAVAPPVAIEAPAGKMVDAAVMAVVPLELPSQTEIVPVAPRVSITERLNQLLTPALPFIVVGWFMGVFALSVWHLGGWTQLQRLRKNFITPVEPTLHEKLRQLAERLGIGRAIDLAESALVQVPTVIGHLTPVILLPATAMTGLSAEQIEAILAHELAHIKRCDYLLNIVGTVVEILGFYHTAVWWISTKIRIERENCCDDIAVGVCSDRVCYAKALATMEEIRASRPVLAVAATGGNLFERIKRLAGNEQSVKNETGWLPAALTIVVILALLVPLTFAMSSRTKSDANMTTKSDRSYLKNVRFRITDGSTGKPLANRELSICRFVEFKLNRNSPSPYLDKNADYFIKSAMTDANGVFTLDLSSLEVGEFVIEADKPYQFMEFERSSDLAHTPSADHIRIVTYKPTLTNMIYDLKSGTVKIISSRNAREGQQKTFSEVELTAEGIFPAKLIPPLVLMNRQEVIQLPCILPHRAGIRM